MSARVSAGRASMWAHLGSLVVFDNAAQRALSGAESTVQHVCVDFGGVALLFDTAADFERSGFCARCCGVSGFALVPRSRYH